MKRKKIINSFIFISLYLVLLSSFLEGPPSMQRGAARGLAMAVPVLFLGVFAIIVINTRKAGGSWDRAGRNIKRAISAMLLFEWSSKKRKKNSD